MSKVETRILSSGSLRAIDAGGKMQLAGYAARFGVKSHTLPQGFCEQIAPGAFKDSIADPAQDVLCLHNHDSNKVLGRRKNSTLQVAEDENGLKFTCQLDKNQQWHRDLWAAVSRRDLQDCSFAFIADPVNGDSFSDGKDEDGNPYPMRTLRNVRLLDCSIVSSPAYPQTSVDARAADYVARHPQSDQTVIRAQIARFNNAHGIIDRRHGVLCVKYPQNGLRDDQARCRGELGARSPEPGVLERTFKARRWRRLFLGRLCNSGTDSEFCDHAASCK